MTSVRWGSLFVRHTVPSGAFQAPALVMCCWFLRMPAVSGFDGTAGQHDNQTAASADGERPGCVIEVAGGNGFVFVNGTYLPPPYTVCAAADSVFVNRRRVGTVAQSDDDPVAGNNEDRTPPMDGAAPLERSAARIAGALEDGSILVAFPERRPVLFESPSAQLGLLEALIAFDEGSESFQDLLVELPEEQRGSWVEWLRTFVAPDDLRRRATVTAREIKAIEIRNVASLRAVRRLKSVAYPLSVAGMLLFVAALGHLLTSHPKSAACAAGENPDAIRAAVVSVTFIAVLSLLDLVWTILAFQAGMIRELNPLGSLMVGDAKLLIAFKLAATLVACGILYRLRSHARARIATWWLCLLCTVLLLRWVIFNSMFVV